MLPRINASRIGTLHGTSSALRTFISSCLTKPTSTAAFSSISSSSTPKYNFIRFKGVFPGPTIAHGFEQIRRSSSNTQGSYHSPSSANQTLLSDVPSISPRSLVKYLDTYVVGQTRAKKVLAVGVWNHYLRVASNQRMKEEAELRLVEQQQLAEDEEELQSTFTANPSPAPATRLGEDGGGLSEASSRSLRLGKLKFGSETHAESSPSKEDIDKENMIQDSWKSHQRILDERKAERSRDPHGEATRSLMFGRSEREWLVNAGGPSAIDEDHPGARQGGEDIVPKFGSDVDGGVAHRGLNPLARRVPAKTPAEEASSQLEQRKTASSAGVSVSGESALAEAALRMHEVVLSDYTPDSASDNEKSDSRRPPTIGVFGADQPLYFSSNTVRISHNGGTSNQARTSPSSKFGESDEVEQKWESPQQRAAHAAGLAEERTKRALKLARERLSGTISSNPTGTTSATPLSTDSRVPTSTGSTPKPSTDPSYDQRERSSENPASFLSSQPGTLPFFEKSNILLLGPSGSGKTLLLRTLAQALDVPFVHVDATPLTMAGYVGDDVESIIQRLLVEAGWDVGRAQRGIVCIDEIDKLRRTGGGSSGGGGGGGKDVGGEGVQQALLRMLEGTTIQVADKSGAAAAAAQGGAGKGKMAKPQQQDGGAIDGSFDTSGLGPWYNHRQGRTSPFNGGMAKVATMGQSQPTSFNVDTSSILFVLSGAFVGIEDVIRKRLTRLDSSPPSSTAIDTQQSIANSLTQVDLLSRLEPTDLEQYGLIPEFIGRVPVSVVLNPLTFDDMVRVMTEPKNSLVDQYTSLFKLNGIDLHVSPGAVEEVVHRAMGTTSSTSSTSSVRDAGAGGTSGGGARSLRRIMEEILLDAFYESYGNSSVKYILVDRNTVKQNGQVKLFSRGQRFDFEAQCQTEAELHASRTDEKDREKAKGSAKMSGKQKVDQSKKVQLDAVRIKLARAKARAVVRARLRRTNRLVDPVIYF